MVDDKQATTSKPTEFYSQENDLATKPSLPVKPALDVWYVRKVGIATLLISMVTIPAVFIAWIVSGSWLFHAAGGELAPWCFMGDVCGGGKDAAVWFVPVFIVLTLALLSVGVAMFIFTRKLLKKKFAPVHSQPLS